MSAEDPNVTYKGAGAAFTSLSTNIKGPKVTIPLYPLTAIVGPNDSGKSSMLLAYELAYRGKADGFKGAGATGALGRLNRDESCVYAEIDGPFGSARIAVDTLESPIKKKHVRAGDLRQTTAAERESSLPGATLKDILGLGSDKGREALIRRFGTFGDAADVAPPDGLTPDQSKIWKELCEEGDLFGDPIARMASLGALIRSKQRSLSVGHGVLERTVTENKRLLAAFGLEAVDLAQWTDQLNRAIRAEGAEDLASKLQSWDEAVDDADRQRRAAVAAVEAAQPAAEVEQAAAARTTTSAQAEISELLTRQQNLKSASAAPGRRLRNAEDLSRILKQCVDASVSACPACAAPFNAQKASAAIDARMDQRKADMADVHDQLQQLSAQIAQAQAKVQQSAAQGPAARALQSAQAAAVTAERAWVSAKDNAQKAKSAALRLAAYEGPSAAECRQKIAEIRQRDALRARIQQDEATLESNTQRKEDLKAVERAARSAAEAEIASIKARAEAAVNAFMGDIRAQFDVEKMAWRVLDGDGVPCDRAQSAGWRWGRLSLAVILGYCAPTNRNLGRILLLDDEDLQHFDAQALQRMMADLAALHTEGQLMQVVMAIKAVDPEEFTVPKGWTKVVAPRIKDENRLTSSV